MTTSNTDTDKNVYILGAGFSKEAGLPLQDDFLLVAKEVYFKNTVKYKHFDSVFKYQDDLSKMRKFLNYPLLNLEALFNLIEMDSFYSDNGKSKEIKEDFTKLVCDVIIEKSQNPFFHDHNGHLSIHTSIYDNYLKFIELISPQNQTDSIISFNYDLILEAAASIHNWKQTQKQDGILRKQKNINFNIIFDKENITADPVKNYFIKDDRNGYFPSHNIYSTDKSAINLLKLHGSINWKIAEDDPAFIVPPTWNKSDQRIRKLWKIAYDEIKNAKRIIIIGYSFPETDTYVKSLITLALNENRILQNIYFINPDAHASKNASLAMLDKHFENHCQYKEWKFSELMSSKNGIEFFNEKLNRKHKLSDYKIDI